MEGCVKSSKGYKSISSKRKICIFDGENMFFWEKIIF